MHERFVKLRKEIKEDLEKDGKLYKISDWRDEINQCKVEILESKTIWLYWN